MSVPAILAALIPVVDVFEQIGAPYYVGGSIASSVHGVARSTANVDLVTDLRPLHVQPLVNQLQESYYIDSDAVKESIYSRTSFNLVHLATMIKVDVFLIKARSYDKEVLRRRAPEILEDTDPPRLFTLPSPEDIVLIKLEWYEQGHRISDRQWTDILGVLKLQGTALDLTYLRRWASILNLRDLLEQAFQQAGLGDSQTTSDQPTSPPDEAEGQQMRMDF